MDLDLSDLSEEEKGAIMQVLLRDSMLRIKDEHRIIQLKAELQRLRRRGALRQGLDPSRSCACCMMELGRIINRGAICPQCRKRICKACRHSPDPDSQRWVCLVCRKQMELKAASGEWMREFCRSSRRGLSLKATDIISKSLTQNWKKDFANLNPSTVFPSNDSNMKETQKTHSSVRQDMPSAMQSSPHLHETSGSYHSLDESSHLPVTGATAASRQSNSKYVSRQASVPNLGRTVIKKISRHPDSSSSSPSSPETTGKSRCSNRSSSEDEQQFRSTSSTYHQPVFKRSSAQSVMSLKSSELTVPTSWQQTKDPSHGGTRLGNRSASDEVVARSVAHPLSSSPPVPSKIPAKKSSPLQKRSSLGQDNLAANPASSYSTQAAASSEDLNSLFVPEINRGRTESHSAPDSGAAECNYATPPMKFFSDIALTTVDDRQLTASDSASSVGNASNKSDEKQHSPGSLFQKMTLKRRKSSKQSNSESGDESGFSHKSSPRGRLRGRIRTPSGSSDDARYMGSVPQIAVSDFGENAQGSIAGSDKDGSLTAEEEFDTMLHSRSHMQSQISLSSFGARSESMSSVYSAAGGGRFGAVTVTGEVLFSIGYACKTGTLEVHVKKCQNLAPVDIKRNRSDPYVKVYLLPDRTKSGKRKTKVKKHTLHPVFDELLKFPVTMGELETRTFWLSVWHSDIFGRNVFLGEVTFPLCSEMLENPSLKWYPLQERTEAIDSTLSYKGDVVISLKFVPPDITVQKKGKRPGQVSKGSLHILVREACNLMATRSNGTSDPFCKSYLLPDKSKSSKQKTSVIKKTCNPKWNHTFVYDDVTIDDLRERCLELTIWDYDKITSNEFLGGIRLSRGTGKWHGKDVDWMDSQGKEADMWEEMLEKPNTWVEGTLKLRPSM